MPRYKRPFPEPSLLKALKFAACAIGSGEAERYALLSNHKAIVCNSVFSAGTPIEEDLFACPDVNSLMLALARCEEIYQITQLSAERLHVRSGDFQAYVPCLEPTALATVNPDAAIVTLSDAVTDALKIVAPLASDKGQHIATSTVLLRSGSVVGTNRSVILEAWHGYDLPTILLPKSAVTALLRCGRKLTGFGCSERTSTFWFDDSWICVRNLADQWPDLSGVLNVECYPAQVSRVLFDSIKQIAPFSDGFVFCNDDQISSHHPEDQDGSKLTLNCEGLKYPRMYELKHLKLVAPHIERWDASGETMTLFYGKDVRGAITHSKIVNKCQHCGGKGCDQCIAF